MNQNPEQLARDQIDNALIRCGWVIQSASTINLRAAAGVAVREYRTDIGPADQVLFVDEQAVGVTYDEIIARDKTLLDITWLKDKSLADLDNLPDPDVLALEIVENLEAGLESFRAIIASLNPK